MKGDQYMRSKTTTQQDNLTPKAEELDQDRTTDVPKGEPQRGEGNPKPGEENQETNTATE